MFDSIQTTSISVPLTAEVWRVLQCATGYDQYCQDEEAALHTVLKMPAVSL